MPARQPIPIELLIKSALTKLEKGTSGEITRLITAHYNSVPAQSIATVVRMMYRAKSLKADTTIRNRYVYQLRAPARNVVQFT